MLNPVLKAMVTSEVIEELTESGQVGRVETKVLTYDGNTEGKEIYDIGDAAPLVRLGEPIDHTKVTQIVAKVGSEYNTVAHYEAMAVPDIDGAVVETDVGILLYIFNSDFADGEYSCPKGTYVYTAIPETDGVYVSEIKLETIHPIEPKFIPGVCLPVVEFSTVPTKDGAQLTEEECALMDALNGAPFVLKIPLAFSEGTTFHASFVASSIKVAEGIFAYSGMFYTGALNAIMVGNETGQWFVTFASEG